MDLLLQKKKKLEFKIFLIYTFINIMKAIILSAGSSTRTKPITDKNLLLFCGKTLIERKIDVLKKYGLKSEDIFIVCGKNNFDDIKNLKIKEKIIIQKNKKEGQGGGVFSAKNEINGDSFLVISSNDVVDENVIKEIIISSKNKDAIITGLKVDNYFPGGYIKFENNKITEIIEKPNKNKVPSNYINIVLHYFKDSKKFFEILEEELKNEEGGYENAITKFCKIKNVQLLKFDGFWKSIKFPYDILDIKDFYLKEKGPRNKISKTAEISKNAVITNSIIGDNVKIFDYAVIKNSFISKDCIIGNFSLVRDSIIGEKTVVGFQTEIARSFLKENIQTHSNYIGDSVICENTSFGAGAKTANLRLDKNDILVNIKNIKTNSFKQKLGIICGKNCNFGINVSFMPGVKIYENSTVVSNKCIGKDLKKH